GGGDSPRWRGSSVRLLLCAVGRVDSPRWRGSSVRLLLCAVGAWTRRGGAEAVYACCFAPPGAVTHRAGAEAVYGCCFARWGAWTPALARKQCALFARRSLRRRVLRGHGRYLGLRRTDARAVRRAL